MLGIRLSDEDEQRFARFARQLGRPKSKLARDWLMERLDRESVEDEFKRQITAIAAVGMDEDDRAWHNAAADGVLRALDEEDGGFDADGGR